MNDHTDETVDLLRRTFAAHDDVTPGRAADLMSQAALQDRPARRLSPILLGVAAALLAVAVVVGGIVWGGGADRSVPVPAGTTVSSGLLSKSEEDALYAQIDRAVKEAGTVEVNMTVDSSMFNTGPSPIRRAPLPETAILTEIDERGDQPRIRSTVDSSGSREITIGIGSEVWNSASYGADGKPDAWGHWTDQEPVGLSSLFGSGRTSSGLYAMGSDDVHGVRASHYLLVTDNRLDDDQIPPMDTPFVDGPVSRTDLWVDASTGRLLRAEVMDEDGLVTLQDIRYGVQIDPIEPPPANQVEPPGPTGG